MFGPTFAGHEKRSEQQVQQWDVYRKVLVYRFGFGAVMPMMELGRCENISEPSESKTKVGMNEDRMQRHENDVCDHWQFVEA